ncbi:MAG: M24 family metallopeptidase [bacterium]
MIHKKTHEQIEAIKEVQIATESAMKAVIEYIQSTDNPTSEEAHKIIDKVLSENNCESPEGHIVAGGQQSAEPHEKGSGTLEKGVPIVIDIYPRSKTTGYFADMSRTVCVGAPSVELQKMYDAVLGAQELALSMIKPKMKCSEIQTAVENFFKEKGYLTSGKGKEFKFAEGFVHSIGHGIGKDLHESPRFGRGSEDVLEEGDVVTVEPGLYYSKIGGIRLEDMILVTKNGAKNLTRFRKEFGV